MYTLYVLILLLLVTTWIPVFLFNPVDYDPLMSFVSMLRLPQLCPALQAVSLFYHITVIFYVLPYFLRVLR